MNTGDSGDFYNSDDALPEGWTVKVKVRSSGRKDKVVFEKAEPKGLPPGWIKEIKVTTKGHKTRRDPYYTDPVSGYVFRSMKDALRYLETGEVGRQAFRPKEKSDNNVELEDDKVFSPAALKKRKLAVATMSPSVTDQSSKLPDFAKDEDVLSSDCTGESMSVPEHSACHCVAEDRISISEVPADDISNQTVGKSDPANSIDTALGILPHEHSMESRVIKDEAKSTGPGKSKKKKELNLPRRVSKRLAGLPLDPTPQLKTTNRARRAAVKQSDDIVASTGSSSHPELDSKLDVKHAFDTFKNRKRSLDTSKIRHPIEKMAAPTEHVGKLETEERVDGKPEDAVVPPTKYLTGKENDGNEKHEHTVVSSSGYLAVREENIGKIETANVADEKLGLPIDLPLVELWQDPCIAFAIRTLTGISFNNTESVQASSGSNNSEFGGVATSEHARKDDGQDERECKGVLSLGNTTNPRELAGETENSDRGDEKPGSPLNLPFGGAWADPCIEFAIKTLTGAIPLDSDMVMQDCLLTKPSSSQSQDSYDLTLQNVCEPGQTNFLCQQFGISEKSLYNQGALTEPTLPHATNMNPGFFLHHQDSDKRSRNCQR